MQRKGTTMNRDLIDITLIVDRSGSMADCQQEAQSGINFFIEEQKAMPGRALLTLVQFDNEYQVVFKGTPIADAPPYRLVPRNTTALLDAVGKTIKDTGDRLAAMAEADRPGLVVIAIITDGHENASYQYSKQQVLQMISQQKDTYNWQFTFLGANQDAFAEAGGIGIAPNAAMSYNTGQFVNAYSALSSNVGRMRRAAACGQAVYNAYTDEERQAAQ